MVAMVEALATGFGVRAEGRTVLFRMSLEEVQGHDASYQGGARQRHASHESYTF